MDGRMTRECWPVTTIASFDITIYTACICGGKECEPFRMIGNIACGTATCQVPVELLSLQEQLRTPTDFVTKRGWTSAHRRPMQLHAIVCAVSSVSSTLYAAHSCCTSCGAEESALMDLSDSFSHVQFLKCSSPQQCSACGYVSMEPDFSGHTFVPSQELWIQPLEDAHGLPGGSRALQQHLQVQLVGGHLAGKLGVGDPVSLFGHGCFAVNTGGGSAACSLCVQANTITAGLPARRIRPVGACPGKTFWGGNRMAGMNNAPTRTLASLSAHLNESLGLSIPMDISVALLLSSATIMPVSTTTADSEDGASGNHTVAQGRLHLMLVANQWGSGGTALLHAAAKVLSPLAASSSPDKGIANTVESVKPRSGSDLLRGEGHVVSAGRLLMANKGLFILRLQHLEAMAKDDLRRIHDCMTSSRISLNVHGRSASATGSISVPSTAVVWAIQDSSVDTAAPPAAVRGGSGRGSSAKGDSVSEVISGFQLLARSPDDCGALRSKELSFWERHVLEASAVTPPTIGTCPRNSGSRKHSSCSAATALLMEHMDHARLLPKPKLSEDAIVVLQAYFTMLRGEMQPTSASWLTGCDSHAHQRLLSSPVELFSFLVSLAAASARLCHRCNVTSEDAAVAVTATELSRRAAIESLQSEPSSLLGPMHDSSLLQAENHWSEASCAAVSDMLMGFACTKSLRGQTAGFLDQSNPSPAVMSQLVGLEVDSNNSKPQRVNSSSVSDAPSSSWVAFPSQP